MIELVEVVMVSAKEIIDIEELYGHRIFLTGVETERQEEVKLEMLRHLFDLLLKETLNEEEDVQVDSLIKMILSGLLSPEAVGWILVHEYSDNKGIYNWFENVFKRKALSDCAVFQAVFFKNRHDMIINNYGSLLFTERHIRQVYEKRYAKNSLRNCFKGKGTVYTVITGGYDELLDPEWINPEWDYICFTDCPENYSSKVWSVRRVPSEYEQSTAVLTQRFLKTHPHLLLNEYDYTIYIDGKARMIGDFSQYINIYGGLCSMLCFPHPSRTNLEEEVNAIIHYGKADSDKCKAQIDFYRRQGYQEDDFRPLVDSACLVRKNNDELLNKTMEDWWNEIANRTHRDQLSLGYVCWKNDYCYDISRLNLYKNDYLSFTEHKVH